MRHNKKFNHLGRKAGHRKAMLRNMAASLIMHKRIHTTVAKAKALRMFLEPLVTRSKEDTMHNRRMVFRALGNKYAVTELFRNISQKVADRPGGYLRIIKLGNRLGDNAEMALIEFVDYNTTYNTEKPAKKTRRRRRKKKTGGEASQVEVATKQDEQAGTVSEEGQEKAEAEQTPEAKEDPKEEPEDGNQGEE